MIYQQPTIELHEFLNSPEDFTFQKLICTTYSLSYSQLFTLAAYVKDSQRSDLPPEYVDVALLGNSFFDDLENRLTVYTNSHPIDEFKASGNDKM